MGGASRKLKSASTTRKSNHSPLRRHSDEANGREERQSGVPEEERRVEAEGLARLHDL